MSNNDVWKIPPTKKPSILNDFVDNLTARLKDSTTKSDILAEVKHVQETLQKPSEATSFYVWREQFVDVPAGGSLKVDIYGKYMAFFYNITSYGGNATRTFLDRYGISIGRNKSLLTIQVEGQDAPRYLYHGTVLKFEESATYIVLANAHTYLMPVRIVFSDNANFNAFDIVNRPFAYQPDNYNFLYRPARIDADGILYTRITDGLLANSLTINSDGSLNVIDSIDAKTFVPKTVDWSAAVTAQNVWTPASGKKFVITDIVVSVSAACVLTLFDETDSTALRIIKLYLAANGGAVVNYRKPYQSATADNDLKYTTSAGTGSLTVSGYEV